MNKWITATAILTTATFFLHVIGGGESIHEPFQQSELTPLFKTWASFLWHAVSLILAVNAIALTIVVFKPDALQPIVLMVLAQFLAFVGLFLFFGITQNENLFVMPQWTIFLVLSVMCGMGLREKSPQRERLV